MKLDPGMHIGLHLVFFGKTGVTQHIQMCAGGNLMEKTLTEAAQLLQNISKAAAMRRDWETRLVGEPEYNPRKKKCAEFSKRQPRKSQKRSQSRKSLKKSTSSQELPRALTSPKQMKQTREVCQA
jgi:hypothetical protein